MKTVTQKEQLQLIEVLASYVVRSHEAIYAIQTEEEFEEIQTFIRNVSTVLLRKIRQFQESDELDVNDCKMFTDLLNNEITIANAYKEQVPDENVKAKVEEQITFLKELKEKVELSIIV